MSRFVKLLLLTIIIIPSALGFTGVLITYLRSFSSSYIPFLLGVVCYTLTYPVFRKPLSSYVIGHELTHILGVWLSHGRIHSVRIGTRGGMVKTDRLNIWVSLLPYFLPIYTVLVIGLYFILSIFLDMARYHHWLAFIIGITWAFHFWMTIYVLRYNQPDIRYSGLLFSLVIIFTINIIILALLLVFISPELNIIGFVSQSIERIRGVYVWILRSAKAEV